MPPLDRNSIDRHDFVLMEAAIVERLRRESGVALHPELVNAPLVHEEPGRAAMARIYGEYLVIAAAAAKRFHAWQVERLAAAAVRGQRTCATWSRTARSCTEPEPFRPAPVLLHFRLSRDR
jgi:hypothetical protein